MLLSSTVPLVLHQQGELNLCGFMVEQITDAFLCHVRSLSCRMLWTVLIQIWTASRSYMPNMMSCMIFWLKKWNCYRSRHIVAVGERTSLKKLFGIHRRQHGQWKFCWITQRNRSKSSYAFPRTTIIAFLSRRPLSMTPWNSPLKMKRLGFCFVRAIQTFSRMSAAGKPLRPLWVETGTTVVAEVFKFSTSVLAGK